jgi:hypothetical protein
MRIADGGPISGGVRSTVAHNDTGRLLLSVEAIDEQCGEWDDR